MASAGFDVNTDCHRRLLHHYQTLNAEKNTESLKELNLETTLVSSVSSLYVCVYTNLWHMQAKAFAGAPCDSCVK